MILEPHDKALLSVALDTQSKFLRDTGSSNALIEMYGDLAMRVDCAAEEEEGQDVECANEFECPSWGDCLAEDLELLSDPEITVQEKLDISAEVIGGLDDEQVHWLFQAIADRLAEKAQANIQLHVDPRQVDLEDLIKDMRGC